MEYKRLTERRGGLIVDKCGNCENVSNPMGCTEHCCYEVMKKRLAELEDKIEQGTLIELPCKVGDTIWCIAEYYDHRNAECNYCIHDNKVEAIQVDVCGLLVLCYDGGYYMWGIKAFLTREEAEKRLKEIQE